MADKGRRYLNAEQRPRVRNIPDNQTGDQTLIKDATVLPRRLKNTADCANERLQTPSREDGLCL